jgi:hypothetical protein
MCSAENNAIGRTRVKTSSLSLSHWVVISKVPSIFVQSFFRSIKLTLSRLQAIFRKQSVITTINIGLFCVRWNFVYAYPILY